MGRFGEVAGSKKRDDFDLMHVNKKHPVALKIAADKKAEGITRFMHGHETRRKQLEDERAEAGRISKEKGTKEADDAVKSVGAKQAAFEAEVKTQLAKELAKLVSHPAKIAAKFPKKFGQKERVLAVQNWMQSITNLEDKGEEVHYKSAASSVSSYVRKGSNGSDLIKLKANCLDQHVAHELGHLIEARKPGILERAQEFLKYRIESTKGPHGKVIDLGDINPRQKGIKGCIDHFHRIFNALDAGYCGRIYKDGATEILSMGLEFLQVSPARFARDDPEFFQFIIGCLLS